MASDEEAELLAGIEAAENRIAALQGLAPPHAKTVGPHWTLLEAERTLSPMPRARAAERLLGAMFELTGRAGTLRTSGEGTLVWNSFDESVALDSQATLDCGPDASILVLQQRWFVPSVFRAMCAVIVLALLVAQPLWTLSFGPFLLLTMLPALILLLLGGGRIASRRRLGRAADTLAAIVGARATLRVRADAREEEPSEEARVELHRMEVRRGVS